MAKNHYDTLVIGTGMGSLSAATLLAQAGERVGLLEQNWQPGGCTSSYWRKGFVFEAGATTLVGMDPHMPLRHLLQRLGLEVPMRQLDLPMQVHLGSQVIFRHQDLEAWIGEAERVFGAKGQRPFWQWAFRVSEFVWRTSLRQLTFPFGRVKDAWGALGNLRADQLAYAPLALVTMDQMLERFGLTSNDAFCRFVDEQLLITAQNKRREVNALFGAAALCYTNYGNYYVDGGLLQLVQPLVDYVVQRGGEVHYRHRVERIEPHGGGYLVQCDQEAFTADKLVWGAPLNNLGQISGGKALLGKKGAQQLPSQQLWSALQLGIGFRTRQEFKSLHHQIHLERPLAGLSSRSFFVSLNHPADDTRTPDAQHRVMSISTHWPNPAGTYLDTAPAEEQILGALEERGFLRRQDIVYQHSSGPKSWAKWTGRQEGFVGGYPQFAHVKPWQMVEHRLARRGAYLVGDTTYPGQGIPGVTLSGIIAVEKMKRDGLVVRRPEGTAAR